METQAIPIGLWGESIAGSLAPDSRGDNEGIHTSTVPTVSDDEEDRGPPIALLRCLQALEDDGSSKRLALSLYHGDNLVGRSSKCDVVIDDCTVSDIHAELIIGTDYEVNVKDLKSR
jgi:hypothetical protein